MRRKILVFIIATALFPTCRAYAQDSLGSEKISSFNGEIKVNSDSTVNVKETIAYDFGDRQKHGIFRFIPIKYKARGGNFNLRISGLKVADENGMPYNFKVSYPGNNVEIKIGDADKLVSGQKTYVIGYTIRRAINYFPDHDELYWNFTGDQWQIPIENGQVSVIFPEGTNIDKKFSTACFEGRFGSTKECFSFGIEREMLYNTDGLLNPGEGMTIVAGWPKGITREPTWLQKIWDITKDNWTLFIPFVIFGLMFQLWWKKGRDPKGRGTIIAQYEPPDGLAPAEIGTVADGSADNKDVSATVIDLAVRGFLKIKRTEEKAFLGLGKNVEYTFTKTKDEEPERDFEKETMKGIFGSEKADALGASGKEKKLSELKNKFYKTLSTVKDQLYKDVTKKGYYVSNPNSTRILWIVSGVIAGGFLAGIFGSFQGAWGIFSGIISGIIILIFGWLMPAVTKRGAELKENILGFKEYLAVTETDRLKFHNAPEKNPQMFEKFLPHAMVLGVEKEWAKQFEGIYNQQPDWYEDPSGRMFNAVLLSAMVSDFSSSAMTTMSSQPSSAAGGGSGFSGGGAGGGFGGGGGGSW